MNYRTKWNVIAVLFCGSVLVGTSALIAEEQPPIFPEDPLLLIGSERLELLIRALKTRENVEILLGKGVPMNREGAVRYVVLESKFYWETRFVGDVEVHYDAGGVKDIKLPFRTEKLIVSPKVVGAELAGQVPKTVESTKEFLEKSRKSSEQKEAPGQSERKN